MLTPYYQNSVLIPIDIINRKRGIRAQRAFPILPADNFNIIKQKLIGTIISQQSSTENSRKFWISLKDYFMGIFRVSKQDCSNEKNFQENRFLSSAANGNLQEFLTSNKCLLEKSNSSVDIFMITDGNQRTCLQLASGNGHLEIVDAILKIHENIPFSKNLKRPINYSSLESPESALLLALANGYEAIALLLIKTGSYLVGSAARSRNIVFLIARSGFMEAAKLIVDLHGPIEFLRLADECDTIGFDSLMAAALLSQDQMCSYLLELGQTVGHNAKDGSNALHIACRSAIDPSMCLVENKVSRTMKELLKKSSLSSLVHADGFGCTPLHIALLNGNYEAVKCILNEVNDIKFLICQDNDGMHPLHTVCSTILRLIEEKKNNKDLDHNEVIMKKIHSCSESLYLMIRSGYPVDCLDYGDASIFHILCYSPQPDQVLIIRNIIKILDEKGFSQFDVERILTLKSENDLTCLHTVTQTNGNQDSIDELISMLISNKPIFNNCRKIYHNYNYHKIIIIIAIK